MLFILAFAFFIGCLIVDHISKKRVLGNVLAPASNAVAGLKRTPGELALGEHWQAWADTIRWEGEVEEQAEIAQEFIPAARSAA